MFPKDLDSLQLIMIYAVNDASKTKKKEKKKEHSLRSGFFGLPAGRFHDWCEMALLSKCRAPEYKSQRDWDHNRS